MTGDPPGLRVLVVDDEPPILEAYHRVLLDLNQPAADAVDALESELFGGDAPPPGEAGTRLAIVSSRQGDEAVAAVAAAVEAGRPFAVAFLDVRMPPGIDGVEAAARIRRLDADVNIVIVTGYADRTPRDIARLVPPLDKLFYVTKPFQPMELQQFALALTAKWQADCAVKRAQGDLAARYNELASAYAALTRATHAAESAQRAKAAFLANMNHELRTPLSAVLGFTDLLRQEPLGPLGHPTYREYLDDIHYSGTHLLHIVNDLLEFSQMEADKLDLQEEDCDADEIVGSVAALVRDMASRAGVSLGWRRLGEARRFVADGQCVRQILLNLLSNAIKFTPRGGRAEIVVAVHDGGEATFDVCDTGVGIEPDRLQQALAPFEQLDDGLGRRHEGMGLGLPLSKRLAELHGGSLSIDSAPGRGTTVTVRLPPPASRDKAA